MNLNINPKTALYILGALDIVAMLVMWVIAIWINEPRWAYTSIVLMFAAIGIFFTAEMLPSKRNR